MSLPALNLDTDAAILGLVAQGDLKRLTDEQKARYYILRCQAVGIDPASQPFEYLTLNGKLVLYAKKGATDQLNRVHQISHERLSAEVVDDIYEVWVRARDVAGRSTDECGAVSIRGLSGEALCNARMKAVTKAKRRATLSHCGLGMLDESELDTEKGATPGVVAEPPAMPRRLSERPEAPPPDPVVETLDRETARVLTTAFDPDEARIGAEVFGEYGEGRAPDDVLGDDEKAALKAYVLEHGLTEKALGAYCKQLGVKKGVLTVAQAKMIRKWVGAQGGAS